MARRSCAACMSILRLDEKVSGDRCSDRWRTNAAFRASHVLRSAHRKIREPLWYSHKEARYRLLREETAEVTSNKTVGSGSRRYYFEKALG
jgi:hypothetical protein